MSRNGTVQISAYIEESTKEMLERLVRSRGLTRARVLEDALLHHLRALAEIPDDAIVPARVVLSAESADRVAALLEDPPEPTDAMRALMSDD